MARRMAVLLLGVTLLAAAAPAWAGSPAGGDPTPAPHFPGEPAPTLGPRAAGSPDRMTFLAPAPGSLVVSGGMTTVAWIGAATPVVQEDAALASPGACGPFTAGPALTEPGPLALDLPEGCHRWRAGADVSGTVLVDRTPPDLSVLSPIVPRPVRHPELRWAKAVPVAGAEPLAIDWSDADAATTTTARTVGREHATPVDDDCTAVTWEPEPAAPASPPVAAGELVAWTCYRWAITATDLAGNVATVRTSPVIAVPPAPDITVSGAGVARADATTAWFRPGAGDVSVRVTLPGAARLELAAVDAAADWGLAEPRAAAKEVLETSLTPPARAREVTLAASVRLPSGAEGSTARVRLAPDADAPFARFAWPAAGVTVTDRAVDPVLVADDPGSGIASTDLRRERATAPATGDCTGVAWVADPVEVPEVPGGRGRLLPAGACYRWTATVTDLVGNATTVTSGTVRIDVSEDIALVERLARAAARLPVSTGITSRAEAFAWMDEILPYLAYDGIVATPRAADDIDWVTQPTVRDSFHLLGRAACKGGTGGAIIELNPRFGDPASPWYGRGDTILVLIHELIHVQGGAFCGGASVDTESITQVGAYEIAAAMIDSGNLRLLRPWLDGMVDMGLRKLSLMLPDAEYQALVQRVVTDPAARAYLARSARHWASDPDEFRRIRIDYSLVPFDTILDALHGGMAVRPEVTFPLDDTAYLLGHVDEMTNAVLARPAPTPIPAAAVAERTPAPTSVPAAAERDYMDAWARAWASPIPGPSIAP